MKPPNPRDYPHGADYFAAVDEYHQQASAERDAALLLKLAELGARTTRCVDGYGPFDSCPICD